MSIDLEAKSNELKEFVAEYSTSIFLGNISLMMQFIASPDPMSSLSGLSSPQRQLYYVAALNLTSNPKKQNKQHFSDKEWDKIKGLLQEIEDGYQQFFYPKSDDEVNETWLDKRRIAMPSFLAYFNQGQLNYEEQIIERVIEYFMPLDGVIKAKFGLSVSDFLAFYEFIDKIPQQFLDDKINHKEDQESWHEFVSRMAHQGIMPDQWMEHMPEHFKNFFGFMMDNGKMYRIKHEDLEANFGKEKTASFLKTLCSKREETVFLYYTEKNPLYVTPLFQVSENEYQIPETKQLIHSIYNLLYEFCSTDAAVKNKFLDVRGVQLEDKIIRVFRNFLGDKATIYQSYYTTKAHEQDILILVNGTAFIIEAKSSKIKEPRRDPDKAYDLILTNFDETIQKGYDQAYRVKEFFIDGELMKLYSDQGLKYQIAEVKTKKYYRAFSIIVTLERFGQIQNDLSELLEIYNDDTFPWSICIDDLEVFLLTLTKKNKKLSDLVHFLNIHSNLHDHLICSDELEVCAAFLKGMINMKVSHSNQIIKFHPSITAIFDDLYHWGGLGFENEKNMHLKTDTKYFRIGVDSIRNKKAEKRTGYEN